MSGEGRVQLWTLLTIDVTLNAGTWSRIRILSRSLRWGVRYLVLRFLLPPQSFHFRFLGSLRSTEAAAPLDFLIRIGGKIGVFVARRKLA